MNTDQTDSSQMTNDSSQAPEETGAQDPDAAETPVSEETSGTENGATEQRDEIEVLEEEIDQLKEERDELNDRLLRKAAELENYRRRMEREKERRYEAGKRSVIEAMLEVLDDFERSMEATRDLENAEDAESAYESLKGGVEMVFSKFRDELQSLGVEPIEAEGEPFDEQLHEAMMRQPSEEADPGTVLQEIRKGYTMGDRVIRHSRVVVAAEPEADNSSGDEPEP
ncbi:MAG: nucleotide exchange factor GrpE [Salinibacter sp.]|uniref:nucleotide exchange factor GrpE n=1 Tax=Salinibacter sp. TaxID=2065818 RepID=UPI0035D452BC